jgi:hypothetical protein
MSTAGDPASQILRELIGMEDIIQGMSRRKLIEIGSAIAPVTVLSGVGVAQQASAMSQVPTRVSPQNQPLDEESPDSVWPPSTDRSDRSTFQILLFIYRKRWMDTPVTQKDFPISKASLGSTCTSKQITTEHWKDHEFGGKYDFE